MEDVELQPVSSSNLSEVGYDPNSNVMTITFVKGGQYRYFNVPLEIFEGLTQAASPGVYFRSLVRNQYHYERVN